MCTLLIIVKWVFVEWILPTDGVCQAAAKSQPSAYSRYDQERFRGKEGEYWVPYVDKTSWNIFI